MAEEYPKVVPWRTKGGQCEAGWPEGVGVRYCCQPAKFLLVRSKFAVGILVCEEHRNHFHKDET